MYFDDAMRAWGSQQLLGGSGALAPNLFAPTLARQSTGMLEASELHEHEVADRFRGRASEKATERAEQLNVLQRSAAAEQQRQKALAVHTAWRGYPSVMYYGLLAGLRLSVLSQPNSSLWGSSTADPSTTNGSSSAIWELSTVLNGEDKVATLTRLSRSIACGNRLRKGGRGHHPTDEDGRLARFCRRHCCFYQFGPDMVTTALECGATEGPPSGPSDLSAPQGAGVRSGASSAVVPQTSALLSALSRGGGHGVPSSSEAGHTFNVIDNQSYVRYVEALLSAWETFSEICRAYKLPAARGFESGATESNSKKMSSLEGNDDDEEGIDPALECLGNLSLLEEEAEERGDNAALVGPARKGHSVGQTANHENADNRINDHTVTVVCAAHPRHKNFSLHLFCEGGGSSSPRLSALLVSDSAAFQREVTAQLKRVWSAAAVRGVGEEAWDAEWLGGALFVQEVAVNGATSGNAIDRQSASTHINRVFAVVDVILNLSLLCEVPALLSAAPPLMRGVGSAAAPTALAHRGSCTIIASFPFSGAQKREILMRPLQPQRTTVPFIRSYASLVQEGNGGLVDAPTPLPVAPLPLPATRSTFLLCVPTVSASTASSSLLGSAVITPRALRAVLLMLVEHCSLSSFELEGLVGGSGQYGGGGGRGPSSHAPLDGKVAGEGLGASAAQTTTGQLKGLALLAAPAEKLSKGHAALSSLDAGAAGNAIVSYRLYPTRLCCEDWVSVEEQEEQGIEPDDSGFPRECMFYPSKIEFRKRSQPLESHENHRAHAFSSGTKRTAGQKSSRDGEEEGESIEDPKGSFRISNTVLWYLDDDDDDEEAEDD